MIIWEIVSLSLMTQWAMASEYDGPFHSILSFISFMWHIENASSSSPVLLLGSKEAPKPHFRLIVQREAAPSMLGILQRWH